MSETDATLEAVWRLFRDQRERCAGCGVRLKWDEREVRGRAGSWVLAEEDEPTGGRKPACVCYRCAEHEGPKTRFHFNLEGGE